MDGVKFTPDELAEKINSGEITIQYEPVFIGCSHEYVKGYILAQIDKAKRTIKFLQERHPERELQDYETYIYIDEEESLPMLYHWYQPLKIYNEYLGDEVYLGFNGNEIFFIQGVYIERGPKELGTFIYRLPDMTGIMDPTTWEINIPSSRVVFVNFFRELNEIPDDIQYSKEYSLNGIEGRRNLTNYFAKENNIGYGQMGNMGIAIYSNGDEIIISGDSLAEHASGEYSEREEYIQSAKDLISYMDEHKMEYKGYISLSMWRYECGDFEAVKHEIPELEENYQTPVGFAINGTKLVGKHYYHTNAIEPELGELCYARIKVEK